MNADFKSSKGILLSAEVGNRNATNPENRDEVAGTLTG